VITAPSREAFEAGVRSSSMSRRLKRLCVRHGSLPVIDGVLQGWAAFELVTTYGLPFDIVQDMARENGLQVDRPDFEHRFEEFRQKSRGGGPQGLAKHRREVSDHGGSQAGERDRADSVA